MAHRESYRKKYLQSIGNNESPIKKEKKIIDPLLQKKYLDGEVILIDKPLHWTSFDIVRKLRSVLQIKKIGHAGTLDPLATGLLIVCTGKFTKKINEYMAKEKTYTGTFTIGATTPTCDMESKPENIKEYAFVSEELINKTTKQFIGTIEQMPPIYSAIKKDGVALYELARRGEDVELKPRTITITDFEITDVNLPTISFKVRCSTGTYIRSLANDFGVALGCGAYLSSLRRTAIGECCVDDAVEPEAFEGKFMEVAITKTDR